MHNDHFLHFPVELMQGSMPIKVNSPSHATLVCNSVPVTFVLLNSF